MNAKNFFISSNYSEITTKFRAGEESSKSEDNEDELNKPAEVFEDQATAAGL
jgi:hypothetical protein